MAQRIISVWPTTMETTKLSDRKLFRKSELWLIIPLLLLGAGIFLLSGLVSPGAKYAVIEHNGRTLHKVRLSEVEEPQHFTVGKEHTIEVEIGSDYAAIISSTCPDGSCVRTGRISKSGQSAICLPGRIVLRLTGGEGFDGETY